MINANEYLTSLYTILDLMPDRVYALSDTGTVVFANQAECEGLGLERSSVIGNNLQDLMKIRSEAEAEIEENKTLFEKSESLFIPEKLVTQKDGSKALLSIHKSAFVVPFLNSKAVLNSVHDFTDLMQAKRFLFSEKELLRVTLQSLQESVIAVDLFSRITLVNSIALQTLDMEENEVVGAFSGSVIKLHLGLSSEALHDPLQDVIAHKSVRTSFRETYIEKKSGDLREVTERSAPIFDSEGNVIGAVMVFEDVSDRRVMEKELEKIQKIESLALVAGGIAHDFNNILASVIGSISLAKLSLEESHESFSLLVNAETAILQAKNLTEQLRNLAKGKEVVNKKPILVFNLIETAKSIVLGSNNYASTVEFNLTMENPELSILGDQNLLVQVFQNLFINGIEACANKKHIEVLVEEVHVGKHDKLPLLQGEFVRIQVKDSGTGMTKEMVNKIFDPYFTTKSRGSGLGLTIAFSAIKKHSGCISVESELNKGTSFFVYLPKN